MNDSSTQPARYTARWVIPVSSPPVEYGAVLVINGRIAEIGPASSIPLEESMTAIDLGAAILMPGMINVHAHPELSVLRGSIEDLPFNAWILRLRRIKFGVKFSGDDWRDAARWTCAEAAAAGVTALGATEDSDAALHALRDAGMRGVAFREVFAPSPADSANAMQKFSEHVAVMRALETDLVRVGVSPHAPYSVCDDLFSAVAQYAEREHLPVAVHASESDAEQRLVTRGDGEFAAGLQARGIATPVRADSTTSLLVRTGILELAPLLIHSVRVSSADIAAIAASGSSVAHCPVANARLGHGIAPVAEMLDAGVNVAIGSDSVASNNRIDLLEEARTAQLMQRVRLLSSTALPPATLLRMVTIDGAHALGIQDRVGTLERGKDADLCAISLEAPHNVPVFDPLTALFMSARGTDVMLTVVRGRIIFRDGAHHTIDMRALGRRMDDLGARVRAVATSDEAGTG